MNETKRFKSVQSKLATVRLLCKAVGNHVMYEGVFKSFRNESITKYKLTTINIRGT